MRLRRTADGYRLIVSRRIDAPREVCWEVLRDTELWPAWGPSVRAVESPTRFAEVDTTGRVRVSGGLWIPFEVTTCADYRWTWRVGRPSRSGEGRALISATGHRVEGLEESCACRVGIEIPPVVAAYAPVCRRALREIERLVATTARR